MQEDPAYSKGGQFARVFRASGYKNPPGWEEEKKKKEKKEKKEEDEDETEDPKESATPKFDKLLGELTYGYKPGELEDCVRKCMDAYRNDHGHGPNPTDQMPTRELVKHCVRQCTANRR